MSYRSFLADVYFPTPEHEEFLKTVDASFVCYSVYEDKQFTQGEVMHLKAYIHFGKKLSLIQMMKRFPQFQWIPSQGTAVENATAIKTWNSERYYERGNLPNQLVRRRKVLNSNRVVEEIAEVDPITKQIVTDVVESVLANEPQP